MISVLMSVYNETLNDISQSIDSILTQTYSDFELIVVLDNPEYEDGYKLLCKYAKSDSRVKILVNEKNIGLALSMNRAAEEASGEYLLRMDSDDICFPDRFEKQYNEISSGKYDLVCANYDFIDENGNLLPQKPMLCNDRQLDALLPYRNVIHHPTIIMTAEIFHRVGGYRNYPCAQDYDLWLRMKCSGCRMHMMSERVIQYRVRQASVTLQKRYKQFCTGEYIRGLYTQKDRMSGYSYEGYLAYLDEHKANDPNANADFIKYSNLYLQCRSDWKSGDFIKGISKLYSVFFKSKYYKPHVLRSIQFAMLTKLKK